MTTSRVTLYLFAGDSLTAGAYGESYVERAARSLYRGDYGLTGEAVNAGLGGDTVLSLLRRIDRPLRRYQPHWTILAVGGNDAWYPWLSEHSVGWRLWAYYRRLRSSQMAVTDLDQFAAAYRALIDKARQVRSRVMACTVSPVGESLSSPINRRVARINGVIKHVAADCDVPVADIWQAFVEPLAALPSRSGYLPAEWLFVWFDRRRMAQMHPDEIAERRRLYLTFDGIHLNSRGADLWADTILRALAQSQGMTGALLSDLGWQDGVPCFAQGPLTVCYTPGWEVRAHELGQLLSDAYERLSSWTGADPRVRLAVFDRVGWSNSRYARPYPRPSAQWDGSSGLVLLPDAYGDGFLRTWHLPELVAIDAYWPPDLAHLGGPARATALVDLLAVEELAHLFLQDLRVAPSDPALRRLLAAYLTQIVLHAQSGDGKDSGTAGLVEAWNAWGEILARDGVEEGRVRLQAQALYDEHGDGLVPSFTGRQNSLREQITSSLAIDSIASPR
jgi:lysophospholipase L1-like esterase